MPKQRARIQKNTRPQKPHLLFMCAYTQTRQLSTTSGQSSSKILFTFQQKPAFYRGALKC